MTEKEDINEKTCVFLICPKCGMLCILNHEKQKRSGQAKGFYDDSCDHCGEVFPLIKVTDMPRGVPA